MHGRRDAPARGPSPTLHLVTPGIRPAGSIRGDQARVMTPQRAFAACTSRQNERIAVIR